MRNENTKFWYLKFRALLQSSVTKRWRHLPVVFTENIPRNILQWNRRFEQLDFYSENHIIQNINRAGQNGAPNGNTAKNVSMKT